jgi:hypothetical protein
MTTTISDADRYLVAALLRCVSGFLRSDQLLTK